MAKNRVRELRTTKGLTVQRLAESVGISHPYLVRIENGQRGLSVPIAERLATVMGVSVHEVLGLKANTSGEIAASGSLREDAEPYTPLEGEMIPAMGRKSQNIDRWRIKSNAIDRAGIRAGAVVFVDISADAVEKIQPLDCVIAQIYASDTFGAAETVVRQFVPPSLLITNSSENNAMPLDLEKGDAYVKGVICGQYRPFKR